MGNSLNQSDTQKKQCLPINYELNKVQNHAILGQLKYITNTTSSKQYIMIERTFASEVSYENHLKRIKNRNKLAKMKQKYLSNEYIVEVLEYRSQEYNELCGKMWKVYMFVRQWEMSLSRYIQERNARKQPFSQEQLVEFILGTVNCLIELYDHNIKPYHISSQTILIFGNSKYKVIDTELTSQLSPLDSLNFRSQLRSGTYLAPQLLKNNIYQKPILSVKSDIWTLGFIVLQMIAMRKMDELYDYGQKIVLLDKVKETIDGVQFSAQFKSILGQMLQEQQTERIGLLRLKQAINKSYPLITSAPQSILKSNNFDKDTNTHTRPASPLTNANTSKTTLIYLGKHPKPSPNVSKPSPITDTYTNRTSQQPFESQSITQRKNSFHVLLNDKIQSRNKKSFSFNVHKDCSSNQRRSSVPKMHVPNYQTPIIEVKKASYIPTMDVSDIRSDTPVSPITSNTNVQHQYTNQNQYANQNPNHYTYQTYVQFLPLNLRSQLNTQKQTNIPAKVNTFNGVQIVDHKKLDYGQITHRNSKTYDIKKDKNQQQERFEQWVQKQKEKIRIKKQSLLFPDKSSKLKNFQEPYQKNLKDQTSNHTYPYQYQANLQQQPLQKSQFQVMSSKLLEPSIPSFSNLQSNLPQTFPSFQVPQVQSYHSQKKQLMTSPPSKKMNKNEEIKTFSNKLYEDTPIKTLQLMQTGRINKEALALIQENGHNEDDTVSNKIQGRYDFSNGAVYDGQFNSQNQFQGNGTLYFPNGSIFYQGTWHRNQFHGYGILNNLQSEPHQAHTKSIIINYHDFNLNQNYLWTQYEGQFYQDKKHGFGTLYFVNGDKFSGCFVNDQVEGFGSFWISQNESKVMGIWTGSKFVSK